MDVAEVRAGLLSMSTATIDRALRAVRSEVRLITHPARRPLLGLKATPQQSSDGRMPMCD